MENLPVGIANSYCHFSGDNIMLFFLHYQYGTNLSLNKRTLRRLFFLFLSVIRFSLFVFMCFIHENNETDTDRPGEERKENVETEGDIHKGR